MGGFGLGLRPTMRRLRKRAGPQFLPIVNRINMTVADLGNGSYQLNKSGGIAGTYDASAVSTVAARRDFTLKIEASYTDNQTGFVGMNADPLASDSWQTIDRCVLWSSGSWYIYENLPDASNPASFVGAVDGPPLWIRRIGTTIDYLLGAEIDTAEVKYTSPTPSAEPLFFDSSIQDVVVSFVVTLTAS